MNILLTGGSGFVGRSIISHLGDKYNIVAPTSSELNLTNSDEVDYYINKDNFHFIVIKWVSKQGKTCSDCERSISKF